MGYRAGFAPAGSKLATVRLALRPPQLVGRDQLLAELRERLTAAGPSPRLIALHGLGGVGKTSVAVEYAHRHQDEYGIIWQLAAEDPKTLSTGFGELAAQLGVRDDHADPVAQVHAALATRTDRWLLLLDNVIDADVMARLGVLPPAGDGHILLTTRFADWHNTLGLEVPVLDRRVAANFLITRTD